MKITTGVGLKLFKQQGTKMTLTRPTVTTRPAITGTPVVGKTLTVSQGTWTGATGYSYQWTRAGTNIAGASSASYKTVLADVGKLIGARVSATGPGGKASSAATGSVTIKHVAPVAAGSLANRTYAQNSGTQMVDAAADFTGLALTFALVSPPAGVSIAAATGLVSIGTSAALATKTVKVRATNSGGSADSAFALTVTAPARPINDTRPAITGTRVVGQSLAVSQGSWTGATGYGYQWLRAGAVIAGATAASYRTVLADEGQLIGAKVAATGPGGTTTVMATGPVTVKHVAPVSAGSLADQTFAQNSGAQTVDAAADFTGQALTFALVLPPAGVSIAAATGLVSIDTSAALAGATAKVRATNSGGSADSAFGLTVAASPAPENDTRPAIGGTTVVGQTLTVSQGSWTGATSYAYQWTRDGADIAGATSATYTTVLADVGKRIEVRVVATGPGGTTTSTANGAITVTHMPPMAAGGLADQSFAQNSGLQTVDAAADFTGLALSFALVAPPAGVTIAAATGLVSINTAAALAGATVKVRATNSGGSADSAFGLTVAAPAATWSVAGGTQQIVITAAPVVAAPTATGGTQQITIIG